TPTPLGEGKTVTTIGLSMALNRIGERAIACIRQPSMGPVFGIKGGGTGGGHSQVIPAADLNLHFTGDMHAVSTAHNLLAAFLDAHIHHGNSLNIDPSSVILRRVIDLSDLVLRHIIVGLGGGGNGTVRETGFDLTPASEVMAILALASDLSDLRRRLGKIIVAIDRDGGLVTAEDLKCAGAMTVLLKDAIKPNLIQTLENTPCLVHAGPFGNIAHGNSSVIADKIAIQLADYVVTEAGFGADMGAEKFFNIKCRYSGLKPDAAVLVCTVRALKAHSGRFKIVPGKPLGSELLEENLPALEEGGANLVKQIENVRGFGIPVVVAVNRMTEDTEAEIEAIRRLALDAGAEAAAVSNVFAKGGEGGIELAEAVVSAAQKKSTFKPLYSLKSSIRKKIETIATQMYGASGVEYLPGVRTRIKRYEEWGLGNLPICMAKTHLSLSHDPNLKGRPVGFTVPVRDILASAGAGFLYVLLGEISTMPSLPSSPRGQLIDIDEAGNPVNLL
ncbi:formate--tetrahydrofolate ligase, partial [Candidatus Poribacteria bacterium]|nr:formate--tetrahydrofolate ligase [Candidatus Poribacteria bacterium]